MSGLETHQVTNFAGCAQSVGSRDTYITTSQNVCIIHQLLARYEVSLRPRMLLVQLQHGSSALRRVLCGLRYLAILHGRLHRVEVLTEALKRRSVQMWHARNDRRARILLQQSIILIEFNSGV